MSSNNDPKAGSETGSASTQDERGRVKWISHLKERLKALEPVTLVVSVAKRTISIRHTTLMGTSYRCQYLEFRQSPFGTLPFAYQTSAPATWGNRRACGLLTSPFPQRS